MLDALREMIQKAYDESDLDLLSIADDILYYITTSDNPWGNVAEDLYAEFQDIEWIMENSFELSNYNYNR